MMDSLFFSGTVIFLLLGAAAGLFLPIIGNIGTLMILPLIIMITGIPPEMAVPIALAHLAALWVPGVVGRWQSGNVDGKLLLWLLLGMIPGITLGNWIEGMAVHGTWFTDMVLAPYLLLLVGAVIYRLRPFPILPKPANRQRKKVVQWVTGLPAKTLFNTSGISISLFVPLGLGFIFGLTGKIFGPVAVLLLSPALMVCLDIPVLCAVSTAVVFHFIGMLSISLTGRYMLLPLNLQILLWLFLGTSMIFLGLSFFMQKKKPYTAPVAVVLVLITSATLWALITSQPDLGPVIKHFSFPIQLLGWFGGVRG